MSNRQLIGAIMLGLYVLGIVAFSIYVGGWDAVKIWLIMGGAFAYIIVSLNLLFGRER